MKQPMINKMRSIIALLISLYVYDSHAQQWSGPNNTTSTITRSAAVKVGYGPLYLDWTYENSWGGNASKWAGYVGFNAFRNNNDTKDYYYGDNAYTSKGVFEGSSDGFRWLYRTTPSGSSDATSQHSLTELMRISPIGYVGIGTASPAYKLHVTAQSKFEELHDDKYAKAWLALTNGYGAYGVYAKSWVSNSRPPNNPML